MRKSTTVKIDGKAITVEELQGSDVVELMESDEGVGLLLSAASGMAKAVNSLMPKCVDINIGALSASELMELQEAFYKVNADFFAQLPARIEKMTGAAEALGKRMGVSLKQRAS